MSRTKGFMVRARFAGRRSLWPYQQIQVEADGLLIRSWPVSWSRPMAIPKEKIRFFAWSELLGFPVLGIYDEIGVLIGQIWPQGDWEKLASILVASGYKFAEKPVTLPDPLVL